MKISIRKARKTDSRSFIDLVVSLARFERLPPPTVSGKQRLLQDTFEKKRLKLFLAFADKKPVGYALYFFTYSSFLARPTLYLEDLFVLDEFRGRGVGRKLFEMCAKEAGREECGRMEWSVLTWNKKAIGFYEKIGAKRLREWYYYRLDRNGIERNSK